MYSFDHFSAFTYLSNREKFSNVTIYPCFFIFFFLYFFVLCNCISQYIHRYPCCIKLTCNVQFSFLFRNSTNRATTPWVPITSSIGGLGSVKKTQKDSG